MRSRSMKKYMVFVLAFLVYVLTNQLFLFQALTEAATPAGPPVYVRLKLRYTLFLKKYCVYREAPFLKCVGYILALPI